MTEHDEARRTLATWTKRERDPGAALDSAERPGDVSLPRSGPASAPSDGRRVRIETLGCRLNEAECQEWADGFRGRGFDVVDSNEAADLIVVNTCAVTQEAVRKSRQLLRRGRRLNPRARLVISGCLATLGDAVLSARQGVDLVVDNRDKDRVVEIALAALSPPAMPEAATIDDAAGALFARGRQRAFIKVQDGCRHQCTFCVATQARGDERSRSPAGIVDAINRLVGQGIHEAVLTGVHLGGYGSDIGSDLTALIARVLAETDLARLRLGSLEPWGLDDAFWHLFASPRLMPHLHLPLQSGSDRILRRMARRCKTGGFARLVERGRAAVPHLNITTDLIVGFPGEDADDWERTLDFAAAMRFGDIHAFAYSPRPGTLAARMPERVDPQTMQARLDALRALAVRSRRAVLRSRVGGRVQVLCEGHPHDGQQAVRFGYTPDYLPVRIAGGPRGLGGNEVLEARLTGVEADGRTLTAALE